MLGVRGQNQMLPRSLSERHRRIRCLLAVVGVLSLAIIIEPVTFLAGHAPPASSCASSRRTYATEIPVIALQPRAVGVHTGRVFNHLIRGFQSGAFVLGLFLCSYVFQKTRTTSCSAGKLAAANNPCELTSAIDACNDNTSGRWPSSLVAMVGGLLVMGLTSSPAFAAASFDVGFDEGFWDSIVNINANLIIAIDNIVGSAGIAIFIYTIFTKALTFPLIQESLRTNALVRLLSPQVTLLNSQYQDDEATKSRMVRALYEEAGVNPLNGLLPTLAQLPIFVALYTAIKKLAVQDDHFKESFLWIPSLAGPTMGGNPNLDWLLTSKLSDGFEPLVGWQNAGLYLILPVVLVVTQLALAQINSNKKEPDVVTLIFPFLVGISTLVTPQGVGIYWFTNSLLTAAQTQFARKQVDAENPKYLEMFEAAKDLPEGVKKGDKVMLEGRAAIITYGPDTDGDCKVKFEDDGSESGFVKAFKLLAPGVIGESVTSAAKAMAPPAPASRNIARAQKAKEKKTKQRKAQREA